MASPKITSQQQRKIEILLEKWNGKLTWDALVTQIELEIGIKTTRQTLYSYTGIKVAYKEKKSNAARGNPLPLYENHFKRYRFIRSNRKS